MPKLLYCFTSSFPLLSALFVALFVTACGGGGGGAVSAPPIVVEPPAPPADTTPPTITLSGEAEILEVVRSGVAGMARGEKVLTV